MDNQQKDLDQALEKAHKLLLEQTKELIKIASAIKLIKKMKQEVEYENYNITYDRPAKRAD